MQRSVLSGPSARLLPLSPGLETQALVLACVPEWRVIEGKLPFLLWVPGSSVAGVGRWRRSGLRPEGALRALTEPNASGAPAGMCGGPAQTGTQDEGDGTEPPRPPGALPPPHALLFSHTHASTLNQDWFGLLIR